MIFFDNIIVHPQTVFQSQCHDIPDIADPPSKYVVYFLVLFLRLRKFVIIGSTADTHADGRIRK